MLYETSLDQNVCNLLKEETTQVPHIKVQKCYTPKRQSGSRQSLTIYKTTYRKPKPAFNDQHHVTCKQNKEHRKILKCRGTF